MLTFKILTEAVESLLYLLEDGIALQDDIALGQIGDAHAFGLGDDSAVAGHQAGDYLHKR